MNGGLAAVLFDLDGTLLDTAPDLARALNALRCEQGLAPLAFEAIRGWVSHGSSALVNLGFPQATEAEFLALRARLLELYRADLARETRPFAGVPELLADIERRGMRWGIVTNKPGWLTLPLLETLGLSARAGTVVSGDSLPERKPHPAPLRYAAAQLAVAPAACLYVGDAERDVEAARAAGMRVVVACFGYMSPSDRPREWPADGWIEHAAELRRWLPEPRTSLVDAREAGA
jgi:N-acetyl-D-muramate 6-phosphate phosphatase